MIRLERLNTELTAAGLPVVGIGLPRQHYDTSGPASFHQRPDGLVRVDWTQPPTSAQEQQAAALVAAHDGAPTLTEKLDTIAVSPRLLLAHNAYLDATINGKPVPAWALAVIRQAQEEIRKAGG